jgi:hypothetical protein
VASRSPWPYVALLVAVIVSVPLMVLLIFAPASQSQCAPTTPVAPGPGGSGLNATAGKMVARAAYDAGWRGNDLVEMVAVSFAESSWNPRSSNGTYAGLWAVPAGTPNVFDPVANATAAHALWVEHLKPAAAGEAGGPDPTPGPFAGNAPVIHDNQTVDGGLPLNIPEEPWQDWPPSASYNGYQQALAFLNAHIGSWGLPAGWATSTTVGAGGGTGTTGVTTTTGTSTTVATGGGCSGTTAPTTNGPTGKIQSNGIAEAPVDAPAAVKQMIAAGNQIIDYPYSYAGGHCNAAMTDPPSPNACPGAEENGGPGYDCSGATSFVLWGGGLGQSFMGGSTSASGPMMQMGQPGAGRWVTVYASSGHAFIIVAGLALDTSHFASFEPSSPSTGPRWFVASKILPAQLSDGENWVERHPAGL